MKWQNNDIVVNRSPRKKTMHIVIERDGTISVQVPNDMPEENILSVLDAKEYDIYKKIAQWKESNQEHVERQYQSGQSFLYLGKNYNLQIVEGQAKALVIQQGKFLLSSKVRYPREAFVRFYKQRAKEKIIERYNHYLPQIGVVPQIVQVKEMPTRWGSCTPAKNIFYNWRCVMAPLAVIDYVVVHELVHLIHPNHSREFWATVSSVLPNYEESKNWLKRNGVKLNL